MTIAVLLLAGLVCALGTHAAVVVLVAAAVVGARSMSLAVVSTWSAVAAAGWLLIVRPAPRRLALPLFGAAAALAAGSARNGAVVLGVWVLSTAAAIFSRGDSASSRRWASALIGSDLFVLAGVALTVSRGFEGWPTTLHTQGVVCLLVAAAIRVPLAAGPDLDLSPVGLVVVRTQWAVLVAVASVVSPRPVSRVELALAAAAFASAGVIRRDEVFDAVQDAALVVAAFAMTRLGIAPIGWAWGALAAGTLIHHLRLSARTNGLPRGFAGVLATAGIGLPFFGVVLAELEGAVQQRGLLGAIVVGGLALGLAVRASRPLPASVEPASPVAWGVAALFGSMAVAASVWAPVLATPHPPAGAQLAWPSVAAIAGVVVAAIACGFLVPSVAPVSALPASKTRPELVNRVIGRLPRPVSLEGVLDAVSSDRALHVSLGVLAAAAAVLWAIGAGRGFL